MGKSMSDKLTDDEIKELQDKKKAIYKELKDQTSAIMSSIVGTKIFVIFIVM
jgi:hypothetical protein